MTPEDSPIADDEWLIRLVWHDRVDPLRVPVISPNSFKPRKDETGGLSLFRRSCLTQPTETLDVIHEAKRASYAVVLVSVRLVRELSFSVRPDPIATIPGHVVIPEINSVAFKADKDSFAEKFQRLAIEASANIIRRPLA